MRYGNLRNLIKLASIPLLLNFSPSLLAQEMCMYIDGVNGGGGVPRICDPPFFPVESVGFGITRTILTPTGSAQERESGAATVSDVQVKRISDANTPVLFEEAAVGRAVVAEIRYFADICGDGNQIYQTVELRDALISGFNTLAEKGERPKEEISLNYAEICIIATPYDNRCKPGSPIPTCYNVPLGKRK